MLEHLFDFAILALLKGFSDAKNGPKSRVQGGSDLAFDHCIRLTKQHAPLAVPYDHVPDVQGTEHPDANLAGESATLLPVDILSAKADKRHFVGKRCQGGQRCKRR